MKYLVNTILIASLATASSAFSQTQPQSTTEALVTLSQPEQTPGSVTAILIKNLRDSYRAWQTNSNGSLQQASYVYTLNGKEVSRASQERARQQFHPQDFEFDEFEAVFSGTFPSKVVLTYRLHSPMKTGRGKIKVFSVYAKQTYEYSNSQWLTTKLEVVSAR